MRPFLPISASSAQRYAMALAAVVVAVGCRFLLTPWLDAGRYAFTLPTAAVVVVGALAGFYLAVVTLVAGGLATAYWLLEPQLDLAISDPQAVAGMAIYLVAGLVCAWIAAQTFYHRLAAETSQRNADAYAQRLEETLASINDVVFTLDRDWRFTYANPQAVQRVERDVLGHNIWTLYPAIIGGPADVALRRAMAERVSVAYEIFYEPWQRWFSDKAYPTADGGLTIYSQEITAAKQQTAALVASEAGAQQQLAELEAIYSTAPIGLCVIDRELRYQRINANLAEINGMPAEAHIGKTVRELLPSLSDQAEKMLLRVLETGHIERGELRGETPSQPGVQRVWDEQWFPLRDPATQDIVGVCAIIQEITERKRAEAELRARTQQLESLLTSAPIGVAFFDRAHRYLRINDELAASNGLPVSSHIGRTLEEVLPGLSMPAGALIEQVFCTGKAVRYEATGETPREPGVQRSWLCGFYPARDDNAVVTMVGCWVVEITERKQAEEALLASEQRMQIALSIAQAGTWDFDMLADTIAWSEEHFTLFGYTPTPDRTATLAMWRDLIVPQDRDAAMATWDHAMRTKTVYRSSHRIRRSDSGEVVWINAAGRFFYNDAGVATRNVGVFFDVTALKEAEQGLLDADRRKDEFLATLAHELRNPLAPLRSSLHVMRLGGTTDLERNRLIAMMNRQIGHIVQLVDDLLEVSRISSGKIELRRETTDLRSVVASAVEVAGPLIEAAGHQLVLNLPDAAVLVNADPLRLAQVVSNLLNNAAKYTESGGRIEVQIRLAGNDGGSERESEGEGQNQVDSPGSGNNAARSIHGPGSPAFGRCALLSVRDSGMGIPMEMLPRVFDLFTQVDRTLGRAQGGLGIGLSLVKNLVELHGGTVVAGSGGPGCGSEFTVRLPLLATEPAGAAARGLPGDAAADADLRHLRILVVDDNRDAAESLAMLLQIMGADIRTAFNGPDALAALHEGRPDIVFLDLGMPGMDGYAVAKAIRSDARYHAVKLVALTGWGQVDDRRRTREAGFDHHCVKPIDPDALMGLVEGLGVGRVLV